MKTGTHNKDFARWLEMEVEVKLENGLRYNASYRWSIIQRFSLQQGKERGHALLQFTFNDAPNIPRLWLKAYEKTKLAIIGQGWSITGRIVSDSSTIKGG